MATTSPPSLGYHGRKSTDKQQEYGPLLSQKSAWKLGQKSKGQIIKALRH